VGFDVITPPLVDKDADPTAALLTRLSGPVSSYEVEVIETDLVSGTDSPSHVSVRAMRLR